MARPAFYLEDISLMPGKRGPSAVDKHAGARLRAARMEAGKSQTEVAEALGITF